jgi:single-strand DNA-binding protein
MSTSSQVALVGRLGAQVRSKELPSGDVITSFTVIVDRPARERTGGQNAATVDAISCTTTRARARAFVERLEPGTVVSIDGTLRRRFWRGGTGGGVGSTMEVVVRAIRKA